MPYNIREARKNIDLILDLAEDGKPQVIRRGYKEVAVVVSLEDWNNLCERRAEYDRSLGDQGPSDQI